MNVPGRGKFLVIHVKNAEVPGIRTLRFKKETNIESKCCHGEEAGTMEAVPI
jgi:hypothetical protein